MIRFLHKQFIIEEMENRVEISNIHEYHLYFNFSQSDWPSQSIFVLIDSLEMT